MRFWALSILEDDGTPLHRDLLPVLEVNQDVVYFDMQCKEVYEAVTYKLDVDIPEDITIVCIQLVIADSTDPYFQVGIVQSDSHSDFLEIKEWDLHCGLDHLVLSVRRIAILDALGLARLDRP